MLIARSEQEELVLADADLCKKTAYYCPTCKSDVHLKVGTVIRPHFAHYKNEACEVFSEGETAEHVNGKLQLAEWLEQLNIKVEMEAYLPALKQRPDLLVTMDDRQIALEFQCSSIPIEKVAERTNGYLKAGYEVMWILGEKFKYTRKLTPFQKACLTAMNNHLVLFHYSVKRQRLEYRYNFQLKQNQKMTQSKRILRKGNAVDLQFEKTTARQTTMNIEIEHEKLLRQLQYPSHKTNRFFQTLYENKETIISMPKEMHRIVPGEWLLQNHACEWKLQFILWLEQYPIHTILTQKMLHNWINNLTYYQIPQLTSKQKMQPLKEFLQVLTDAGVLRQIRLDKWTILQYPKRYKNLEEKLI